MKSCPRILASPAAGLLGAATHGNDAPETFTQWLRAIHQMRSDPHTTSAQVWENIEKASAFAYSLKESDCLLALTASHMSENAKRGSSTSPPLKLWPLLAERLLTYSNTEAHSVLSYRGTDASYHALTGSDYTSGGRDAEVDAPQLSDADYVEMMRGFSQVEPKRQTLVLTAGAVPLSARGLCADGESLSQFLDFFCDNVTARYGARLGRSLFSTENNSTVSHSSDSLEDLSSLMDSAQKVSTVVLRVLRQHNNSIEYDAVVQSLGRFCHLLLLLDLYHFSSSSSSSSSAVQTSSGPLVVTFIEQLCAQVSNNALGGRLAAYYVWRAWPTGDLHDFRAATLKRFLPELSAAAATSFDSKDDNSDVRAAAEAKGPLHQHICATFLSLLQPLGTAIATHYVNRMAPSTSILLSVGSASTTSSAASPVACGMAVALQELLDETVALFQRNANENNVLQLSTANQQQWRLALSLALLRCLRLETREPGDFLEASEHIVRQCVPSALVEMELLEAKARILQIYDLDDDAKATVLDDLVATLRNLLELRPRHSAAFGVSAFDSSTSSSTSTDLTSLGLGIESNSHVFLGDGGGASADDSDDAGADDEDGGGSRENGARQREAFDATIQAAIQRAHLLCITAFCETRDETRINEMYNIVVAHKYHGLMVTAEVVEPLMEALARRGDGRVFNLVDLCLLYSNCPIHMRQIAHLFRCCAVVGDVYRAQSLCTLLQELIPGFLLKATEQEGGSIIESLRELKILDDEPAHLYLTDAEKLERGALGKSVGVQQIIK